MERTYPKCIKCVGESKYIKFGKSKNGKQRYKCKTCGKSFVENYTYKAYEPNIDNWIISLTKESAGIRSIARLLNISTTTVMSKILKIASNVRPPIIAMGKKYEVDELCTFIGNKEKRVWLAYSLRKDTKEVIGFKVGSRTKKTLRNVTDRLVLSEAKEIFTDKLIHYGSLIPTAIHNTKRRGTNHIERMNTTLRCHLKRLNRRTIAYPKSLAMLNAF